MTVNIQTSGKGRALVFFHGWGFDHRVWLTTAQKLTPRFQVHLVDLPGFGSSALKDWLSFKAELIQQLPEQFSVIGWSLGGLYAQRLAVEERQRVTNLVITASSPRFTRAENWPGVDEVVLDRFYNNLIEDPQQVVDEFIALQLRSNRHSLGKYQTSLEGLKQGLHILGEWDLRESLAQYSQRACFIFGRLDAITPPSVMQRMQQLYPQFTYHLLNKAAHMPFVSHPQDYVRLLETFLS